MKFQCEMPDCTRKAKYSLRIISDDKWVDLCSTHDSELGVANLMSLGYTRGEAKLINGEVKSHKD